LLLHIPAMDCAHNCCGVVSQRRLFVHKPVHRRQQLHPVGGLKPFDQLGDLVKARLGRGVIAQELLSLAIRWW
jgi:hypothetical protein